MTAAEVQAIRNLHRPRENDFAVITGKEVVALCDEVLRLRGTGTRTLTREQVAEMRSFPGFTGVGNIRALCDEVLRLRGTGTRTLTREGIANFMAEARRPASAFVTWNAILANTALAICNELLIAWDAIEDSDQYAAGVAAGRKEVLGERGEGEGEAWTVEMVRKRMDAINRLDPRDHDEIYAPTLDLEKDALSRELVEAIGKGCCDNPRACCALLA